MTATRRLLVWHAGALGDWILTLPAILRLRSQFDPIDAVCQSHLGELLVRLGPITQWYAVESAAISSLYAHPADNLVALLKQYSDILLLSVSSELHLALQQACGHTRIHRVLPRPAPRQRQHVARFIIDQLVAAGMTRAAPLDLTLSLPLTRPYDARFSQRTILLHPGAGSPLKRWPLKHFLFVAQALQARGCLIAFIIGPAEHDLIEPIKAAAGAAMVLRRPASLPLLINDLLGAAALVGNDSGVSHLAGALGLPTVTIFGPTDPFCWHPLGPRLKIVTSPKNCAPCWHRRHSRPCAHKECLAHIPPAKVLRALNQLLALSENAPMADVYEEKR